VSAGDARPHTAVAGFRSKDADTTMRKPVSIIARLSACADPPAMATTREPATPSAVPEKPKTKQPAVMVAALGS
jgi:hypothetical protein